MRFYCFLLLLFVLLSFESYASWQTYQNDLRNSGSGNGTGHFPLKTRNFSNEGLGMSFQPLVDDLNNDGGKEIIIFSNNSLILFDPQLRILNQKKVGAILGQPTLFNFDDDTFIEVIFNARQNSSDYFFAYEYGNFGLKQEFNITLPHEAKFSGIKCLKLDGVNSCVFKDKKNYVHIVDMASKNDSFYNTSVYEETRQTIPAIGDIDNDGNMEAVFWFNADNQSGYGFLVFDLKEKKIKWIVDNIFSPNAIFFFLKGQPVLVDLNNDGKLEIAASVYYDDSLLGDNFVNDRYTELFVYSNNGTKLYRKCDVQEGTSLLCNDGNGVPTLMEGTNPFVMDFNKNGIEDICLIQDNKVFGHFFSMAMHCYNYEGDEIADINLSKFPDGIQGTAMAADMNNDGNMEIVTQHDTFLLNGTSIFNVPIFASVHPIAVDVDGNNGLDLVWTDGNRTKVFLDSNKYYVDLSVADPDIAFSKFNESHIRVNAVIKNLGQLEARNVKTVIYNINTLDNNSAVLNIRGESNITFSSVIKLSKGEKVLVNVDFDDEINESDEKNNFAVKEFEGLPYVFVSIGAEQNPQLALQEIKEYIKNNLVSGYFTEDIGIANVAVYLGKTNSFNRLDRIDTMNKYGWGYDSFATIDYFDEQFDEPYAGLVGSYKLNGGSHVAVYGNLIEGDIAAAKEFVKHQSELLAPNSEMTFLIDSTNVEAIGIFDYLHQPANAQYYLENSKNFANVVRNALNGETFNTEMKTVAANDAQLRLKHLIPNRSSTYMEILNITGVPVDMPVVLSRGIHSNLTTWETLAGELADEGRDTWLLEITGGPNTECDACPNYNFFDLTDSYWPALVNGVLNFSGKEKIQYVGHSNGGRVAIESLANGKVNPNKIETFVGVAIPGAFEGYSTFANYFGKYGGQIMQELEGKSHVSMTEIGEKLRRICLSNFEVGCGTLTVGLKSENKMSFNTDKQYYLWIINTTDEQIGKNLDLNNFYVIQGWVSDDRKDVTHDFIVTQQDEKALFNNIISSNKKHYKVWGAHTAGWSSASLPDRTITKNIIKDALNKISLEKYKSNEVNST